MISRPPNQASIAFHLVAFAAGMLAIAVPIAPKAAHAQSFDCQKAHSPDAMAICRDPGLARLDQDLAEARHQRAGKLSKEQREEFEAHENPFTNARRRCGEDRGCIEQSYRNRLRELDQASSEEERGGSSGAASTGAASIGAEKRSQRHHGSQEDRGIASDRQTGSGNAGSAEAPATRTSSDEPPVPLSESSKNPAEWSERAKATSEQSASSRVEPAGSSESRQSSVKKEGSRTRHHPKHVGVVTSAETPPELETRPRPPRANEAGSPQSRDTEAGGGPAAALPPKRHTKHDGRKRSTAAEGERRTPSAGSVAPPRATAWVNPPRSP